MKRLCRHSRCPPNFFCSTSQHATAPGCTPTPKKICHEEITDRFFALIARRAEGEPTQYLTGKQEFWGLEFEVTPAVLIPRPETEHVIEVALDRLALRELRAGRPQKTIGEGLQIADIGTGSGCIAIALAKELPGAMIYATDISSAALEVAVRNVIKHKLLERISVIESNLLDLFTLPFRNLVMSRSG